MKTRRLGAGGPPVSAIGLGCLSFGGAFGATSDDRSLRCLDAAWDAGITLLDTANIYGSGRSETVIGTWLASRRHPVRIATKAGIATSGGIRRVDNSPSHLRGELEGSLRRLNRDHIDLFYIHRHQKDVPIEEVAGTLSRFAEEGKIGGYGLSEVAPGTLRRAHSIHPCRAVQNEYSLWTRQPDLGLVSACAELGVAFVAFSPLARGALGQDMLDPASLAETDFRRRIPRLIDPDWSLNRPRIEAFRAFARARGHAPPALALAWLLSRGPHVIPIPGTRDAAHLADWAGAADIVLSPGDLAEIERILPPGWAFGDRYSDEQAETVERYC